MKKSTLICFILTSLLACKNAPKITLVGKGVTFDSGGLDVKSTGGMKMMKKDMGGAANVLALLKTKVQASNRT